MTGFKGTKRNVNGRDQRTGLTKQLQKQKNN
jgi:hypothetical protein